MGVVPNPGWIWYFGCNYSSKWAIRTLYILKCVQLDPLQLIEISKNFIHSTRQEIRHKLLGVASTPFLGSLKVM